MHNVERIQLVAFNSCRMSKGRIGSIEWLEQYSEMQICSTRSHSLQSTRNFLIRWFVHPCSVFGLCRPVLCTAVYTAVVVLVRIKRRICYRLTFYGLRLQHTHTITSISKQSEIWKFDSSLEHVFQSNCFECQWEWNETPTATTVTDHHNYEPDTNEENNSHHNSVLNARDFKCVFVSEEQVNCESIQTSIVPSGIERMYTTSMWVCVSTTVCCSVAHTIALPCRVVFVVWMCVSVLSRSLACLTTPW